MKDRHPRGSLQAAAPMLGALLAFASTAAGAERWYRPGHAEAGAAVYATHCSACHGRHGAGAANWQQPDPGGGSRAPPLNGTGHAWHHPLPQLFAMIHDGIARERDGMPAWGHVLSGGEILAVIAYFQSWWPNEIYQAWERMDRASAQRREIR